MNHQYHQNQTYHSYLKYRGQELTSAKFYNRGTQRAVAPEVTYSRIRPHFARCGITRIANITGLDRIGIPVTLAIRPNSRSLTVCSGKGFTEIAAIVSGAMEAIELFHAEDCRLPYIDENHARLSSSRCVTPAEDLLLTKNSLFTPNWIYRWIEAWDLVGQESVFVPLGSVEMARSAQRAAEFGAFQVSSNGLASGNTLLEAMTHALLEVIERDATTCARVAWQNVGVAPPSVDLENLTFPLVSKLVEQLRRAGILLNIFDCTNDTRVPVFMAYIYDTQDTHVGIYKGYGAHLDAEIAMVRAITEAVQGRVIYIAGSRDDFFKQQFWRLKQIDSSDAIREFAKLRPAYGTSDLPCFATGDFASDIHTIISFLDGIGIKRVLVVDLSRTDIPVHVVKVIVPRLEGYIFDFYEPGVRAKAHCERLRCA